MDAFLERARVGSSRPGPYFPTHAHTYYLLQHLLLFLMDLAHIWRQIYGQRKEKGRTHYEFPRTHPASPKDSPPLFCAWPNRQDIQSSIPITFWAFLEQTPGPTEPGLAICFAFYCFVGIVVGDDDTTETDGVLVVVLILFCALIFWTSNLNLNLLRFTVPTYPFSEQANHLTCADFIVCLHNNLLPLQLVRAESFSRWKRNGTLGGERRGKDRADREFQP